MTGHIEDALYWTDYMVMYMLSSTKNQKDRPHWGCFTCDWCCDYVWSI